MIEFSTFSTIFKKLRNLKGHEIVRELALEITGVNIEYLDNISDDATSRYYTGGTKFNKLAAAIKPYINRENFIDYLDDNFNDNYEDLIEEFKKNGIKINKRTWKKDITDIFIQIINKACGFVETISVKDELNNIKDIAISSVDGSLEQTKNFIEQELMKSIKNMELVEESKLEPELRENYKVEILMKNDEIDHVLVPRTKESSQKLPYHINWKFDTSTCTIEQINKIKDFQRIINEANLTNKPVLLGTPSSHSEKYGKYDNPFPKIKSSKDLLMFIMPDPDAKLFNWDISLKNKYLDLYLNNIKLHVLSKEKDKVILSNIRFKEDKFDFQVILTWFYKDDGKKYININISIKIREKYIYDVEAIKIMLKWVNLNNDISTKLSIFSNDFKKVIYNVSSGGKIKLTKREYNKLNTVLDYLDKLLYIEQKKHINFQLDMHKVFNEFPAIDLVYYSLKEKTKIFSKPLDFVIELSSKIDSLNVGLKFPSIQYGLDNITILGYVIKLDNIDVFTNEAEIIKIEELDNTQKVHIRFKKAKLIIN